MLRKAMSISILIVLLFALVPGAALAQGPDVYCGSLSEADCNLLVDSQQAMNTLTSSAFDLNAGFSMSSSEEFAPDVNAFAFNMSGNGAVAADLSALADLQGMDPEQMMGMLDTLPQMIADLLRGVTGEATFDISLPAELMTDAPIPSELTLNLLGTDGVLYVDLRSLLPAAAVEQEGMPAWIGLDLAGMYETIFQQMPAMPMDEMQGMLDASGFAQMMTPDMLNQFVLIERGPDETVDGQAVAVFNTTLDYEAMFSSDAFQQVMDQYMQSILEMQGASAEDLPDNFGEIMAGMMSGMQVSVSEWIGLDNSLLRHFDMNMAYTLDPAAIAALSGGEADQADIPDFALAANVTVDLSDFNAPVEVTAPEGAQVINPMMMMPDMATPSGDAG